MILRLCLPFKGFLLWGLVEMFVCFVYGSVVLEFFGPSVAFAIFLGVVRIFVRFCGLFYVFVHLMSFLGLCGVFSGVECIFGDEAAAVW